MISRHLKHSMSGNGFSVPLIRIALRVGGLQIVSLIFGFVTAVVLARSLRADSFGQYAFIMSLMTMLTLPIDKGIRQLVTREVAIFAHDADWGLLRGMLRVAHQWVLGSAHLIAIAVALAALPYTDWRPSDRWTLIILALPLLPLLGVIGLWGALLRGLGHVFPAQLPESALQPGLHLLFVALLLLFGALTPASALISQLVSTALAVAAGAFIIRLHWPLQARAVTPAYRRRAWAQAWAPFTLLIGANMINNQLGILFLGWLSTDEQVAAFRVADRAAQLVVMPLAIVNLVIAPHISRAHRAGDFKRLEDMSRQSARIALAIALPVALPMIFFGRQLITLLFGDAYADLSVTPLAVLATAQLINVAFGSVGMLLTMTGYEKDAIFGQTLALTAHAVLAGLLIPTLGGVGAAYAGAISIVTWNLILAARVFRRFHFRSTAF